MWRLVGGPSVGQPELGRHMPRAQSDDRIADIEPFQHPQPVTHAHDPCEKLLISVALDTSRAEAMIPAGCSR